MPLSMSESAVPPLLRALSNLRANLDKASVHCTEHKIDEQVLVQFRLYPDMAPLSTQVQIACDMSKGCVSRLSDSDKPGFEDEEKTFSELQARIDKTVDYIKSIALERIDGSEKKAISFKTQAGELKFIGQQYLQYFVLPNVYFHCTMAYAILRHNGVTLGKTDFIGRP